MWFSLNYVEVDAIVGVKYFRFKCVISKVEVMEILLNLEVGLTRGASFHAKIWRHEVNSRA